MGKSGTVLVRILKSHYCTQNLRVFRVILANTKNKKPRKHWDYGVLRVKQ